ncbi:prorelaxin H1 isoform X2 [Alosa alosa]|uniref:prorelaxin H1 isoform X2 n=1 Tax=Alosa sapidissima TaxID=34773 RepID=UPI001C0A4E7E|nr:prorelaxin H1 isoform X2 [Alosa sapidissima]XP_048115451.1 prorelaxin H1 isoform X2 [Alosa alosa]
MPKRLSVIFIGACLLVCESAQNSNSKKVLLSKDYGVKLCGREFIRAVIFTCGGSRWKRAMNLDLLLRSDNDFLKLFDDQKQTGAESNEQQLSYKLHFDRKKRNFSHGLAGICCNQGCTKNDIGRLC